MSNIANISLPDDLNMFLNNKKEKSKYVQRLLRAAKEQESNDAPKLLKQKIAEEEQKIAEIQRKHEININKYLMIMKEKNMTDTKERERIKKLTEDSNKKKLEKMNLIKSIPKIDIILKPAISGKDNFDYFSAIDKIRTKNPETAHTVGVYELKTYVEFKQNGGKV